MAAGLRISLGQHSDAGPQPVNQDFHGAALPAGPLRRSKGLAIALADGIGSSAVSQVASAAAVRGFLDDYYATHEAWPVRRAAQRVLAATNSWLHAQNQAGDARFDADRGYVTTFSALVLKGREAHLLHVGDSRIYRLHPLALEQLTDDHRVHVSSAESYLGRALGAAATVDIDYRSWPLETGEVYLLATDGAFPGLDAAAVHRALAAHAQDLDAAARALVQAAHARGSDDNATLQLLRIDDLPAEEASAAPGLQREGLALPPALQPGQRFEGWRILRELHASSRSHVFLAEDEASGTLAVLKTPSVDLRDQPEYLDGFLLEEWVARRLDSPHVLKAAAMHRPRQHLYTAMAHVDGQTLRQWMTDHPQPPLDAVRALVDQIARGLLAFHRKTMLHQDLRPENVMIDRHGTACLIDFGAVHVAGLAEGTAAERPDAIVGALQYVAPEYFAGGSGSPASDLYALAVLTYQMLSGQLPYGLQVPRVRSPADLARLRYIPLRNHRPDLPPWVDALLRKALQPQPQRRPQDVAEFAHELHEPGAALRRTSAPPLIERDPAAFWRALAIGLAAAVVLLLGLLLRR